MEQELFSKAESYNLNKFEKEAFESLEKVVKLVWGEKTELEIVHKHVWNKGVTWTIEPLITSKSGGISRYCSWMHIMENGIVSFPIIRGNNWNKRSDYKFTNKDIVWFSELLKVDEEGWNEKLHLGTQKQLRKIYGTRSS